MKKPLSEIEQEIRLGHSYTMPVTRKQKILIPWDRDDDIFFRHWHKSIYLGFMFGIKKYLTFCGKKKYMFYIAGTKKKFYITIGG
jgi:hypothetical protein